MQLHPIYINLFGTGIRYWVCQIPQEIYEKMEHIRAGKHLTWEHLLFDLDFLDYFGYSHWSDLAIEPEHVGFLINFHNRIEIKQAQRILSRYNAQELIGGDTLFPLHDTFKKDIQLPVHPKAKTFALVHLEKGLVGKFQINTNDFNINDFSYEIQSFQNFQFLRHIYYQNEKLSSKKDDTLINTSLVIHE